MTVLVLRALGLGDFLTSVPALRALRRAHPDDRIVLAAPPALAPLVDQCGAVDAVLAAEPLQPVALREPDVAVNLHGKGPESHRVLLATKPARLVAFANREVPESAGMPEWRADEHEVDRWCRLLAESGVPADPTELRLRTPGIAPHPAAPGATLIHPGAAAPARRWPADRWAFIARAEAAAGHRVAISAGPSEAGLARSICAQAGIGFEAIIEGGLLELAAAVAAAGVVVAADTGVAHLATALGTPSIVLFGPTSPALWGPPRSHRHVVLWSGRTGDPLAHTPDLGLLEITPEQVLDALESLRGRALR